MAEFSIHLPGQASYNGYVQKTGLRKKGDAVFLTITGEDDCETIVSTRVLLRKGAFDNLKGLLKNSNLSVGDAGIASVEVSPEIGKPSSDIGSIRVEGLNNSFNICFFGEQGVSLCFGIDPQNLTALM